MNFLEAIKNHFKLGLLITFLVPAIAWVFSLTVTPVYESQVRLLIEAKDLNLENQGNQLFKLGDKQSNPIQTQIEILKSATILENVIRKFNMRYKSGSEKGKYLNYLALSKNIEVKSNKNVDIVELRYIDPDPKKARNILQAITDSYIEKSIELKASDPASAVRFLKRERSKAEREALDASKRLREYEQRSKIISLEGNQEILKNSYALKAIKLTADADYAKAKATVDQLSEEIMANAGNINVDEAVLNSQDPLRAELIKNLFQAKSNELAFKEQIKVIDRAISEVQKKLDKLPNEKYIYSQLLRRNEMAQKRLEEIEDKLIESKMKGEIASHITNIRVIDPPSLPLRPKSPDIPVILLYSFILGLCLSVIVLLLIEYFDDIIKSIDTLPKDMDCSLLGQLPYAQIGELPIAYKEPKSNYTEAIHSLRTNISFLSLSGNRKLLLITSPNKNEGKSTVSVNLAITYAQSGKRVLLVDADIRNPSLYKYLNRAKDSVGISNTLINEIDFYDVVQKSILGVIGFDYLPGGDVPPNPVQLLESDKMKELLETAQHIYDLVILDTPPVSLYSDALLLARYADIVGIVAKQNKTSRKELTSTIDLIKKTNVPAIGVILNANRLGPQEDYSYESNNDKHGSLIQKKSAA